MKPVHGHAAKAGLGVCLLSGVALFWMRSLLAPSTDDFALSNHPQEPLALALHVASSWAGVFVVGLILEPHALHYLRLGHRPRRRTGWILVASFLPMALSGVGLQVAVSETWRSACLWAHWLSSAAFGAAFLVHLALGKLPGSRKRGADPSR